jgi:hypothetical protein
MPVTVTPGQFSYVFFDADVIRRVAEDLATSLGLGDRSIVIEVDETSPMARTSIDTTGADIHIAAHSGAFEDTRKPRHQSETAIATSLGRVLLRARDRALESFADAPSDADLTLPQLAAWETYNIGRLERLGVAVNRQRWLYNFRNRHGFTDAADTGFDRLWNGTELSWADLCSISEESAGLNVA